MSEEIFCAVEAAFRISRSVFLADTRSYPARDARFALAALLREAGAGNCEIADAINRDRTSIASAIARAAEFEECNQGFAIKIRRARRLAQDGPTAARLGAAAIGTSKQDRPPVANLRAGASEFGVWEMRAHVNEASARMGELLKLERGDA